MLKRTYSATALLIAVSVVRAQQSPVQSQTSPTAVSEITVERRGCFDGCPVYTLTLRRQGASSYDGKGGVVRRGEYTAKQVNSGDFDQLSRAISEMGFFDLQNEYGGAEDAEEVAVTVTASSQSKTVHTSWFDKAPFGLWAVVTLVDGVAANLRWETRKP